MTGSRPDRSRARIRRLAAVLLCAAAALPGCAGRERAAAPSSARRFQAIAHRGGGGLAPENTLPAFRRSLALGVTDVELDVRLSRDRVPVLFHDSSLDAKTSRSGAVSDYTAAELRATDIGTWFDRKKPGGEAAYAGTTLATLDEVLAEFGRRFHYHVELKGEDPALPGVVWETIRRRGLEDRVTITSFHRFQIERIRRLAPQVPVCWILRAEESRGIATAADAGFSQVAVEAERLTPELVALAHARGLSIRAWGVRDEALVRHVLDTGADGMTTARPDRLRALRR